jgi:hypothetical protein
MKKIFLIVLIFTGICFFSCQKEIDDYIGNGTNPEDSTGTGTGGNDTVNVLMGSWTLDSLSSQSQSSSDVSIDGVDYLTLSSITYSSLGNYGSLTIDDSLFNTVGCTYSASGIFIINSYQDGQHIDSTTMPYTYYKPPTTNSSAYNLIGSDSVFFPHGGFLSTDTTFRPYGLHFNLDNNKLVFTQYANIDTSEVKDDGYTYLEKSTGITYLYFHKN